MQQQLNSHAEKLASLLLGQKPSQRSATQVRFGKKGSFVVNIAGTHTGGWHSFETQESGNLIQLIQREKGLGFREALEFAASYCVVPVPPPNSLNFQKKLPNYESL